MAEKTINLYVDTDKPARTSLMKSGSTSVVVQMLPIVAGDILPLKMFFLTNGQIDSEFTSGLYNISASLGVYGGTLYASTTDWRLMANYAWTASMDTNTGALTSSLGTSEVINAIFEVETTNNVTGTRRTFVQTPVLIYNQVVTQSVSS